VGPGRSRRISSWYFGDGALLLNEVLQNLGRSERITPLDSLLTGPMVRRKSGASFGLRFSRRLRSRLAAELTVERNLGSLEIDAAVPQAIEASRASFISAFTGLIATVPSFNGSTVTSVSTIHSSTLRQLFTTGTVNFDLRSNGRIRPYVAGGAGVVSYRGSELRAMVVGNYRMEPGDTDPRTTTPHLVFSQQDSVTARSSVSANKFVSVFGGGVRYNASQRRGIRADVRLYLSGNESSTVVDATPVTLPPPPTSSGAVFWVGNTTPLIQITNGPSDNVIPNRNQSSLSAPKISGFRTFTASGQQTEVNVALGIFWRF